MMKRLFLTYCMLLASLSGTATCLLAGTDAVKQAEVDELVHTHYFEGIEYNRAHALGSEAVPYLLKLLSDPDEKEFWVNIIVTIGFIEDPVALPSLIEFLEGATGEVDINTFKALLSVQYAIGCISSKGQPDSLDYLTNWVDNTGRNAVSWSYRNQNAQELLYERSLMALAVSGRPEAKAKLLQVKKAQQAQGGGSATSAAKIRSRADVLDTAFQLMSRIEKEGRLSILNPHVNR